MKINHTIIRLLSLVTLVAVSCVLPNGVLAHCDTMDGPVVKAAQKALETGDINLVLIWVEKKDEPEIKSAFERTRTVRTISAEAREFADMYFFETLVRIHRAGEGEPYTGLKPAGNGLGLAIPAADKAIADGKIEPVFKLLNDAFHEGLHERFKKVMDMKDYNRDNVLAGRKYVEAYVAFMHYVEGLYEAASMSAHEHQHISQEVDVDER